MSFDAETRARQVTAVLGPTNTGKTHLAIERMLGHSTGMIGLPLRLLAREVYEKIVARVGVANVALITGEEKIKPDNPRFWVCTVEAMPRDVDPDFLAIDEIQLAADPERGHVFTDRLLNARGRQETLFLGAATMRDAIAELIPGANFIARPRLSKLTYAGDKKITRLPTRSAVVAFSAAEVYEIAELIRRQRGGAAVVLGALSPRTRNAQVELFQNGDVDFIVATDAIGMGLNLDVDHVALAATRKFDGQVFRDLMPAELAQIAGRAGRHLNDGTFGVTNNVPPLTPELIEQLENHAFEPIKHLQWRARDLDFSTLPALRESLRRLPREQRLQRARMSDDVAALEALAEEPEIRALVTNRGAVMKLWDVCQIPDYRKISTQNHSELIGHVFKHLQSDEGLIPEDWFRGQVAFADVTDGDIDTLATRLAHIRTWTFVANRPDWLRNATHWQARTREIEDKLSDALHERLTMRFVDRRASALVKGLRDKDELSAQIGDDGSVVVENHPVGKLKGFRFIPETQAEDLDGRASRSAAAQVLTRELQMRARRVISAKADAFRLDRKGQIVWKGDAIAQLSAGDAPMKPNVVLLADEQLQAPDREKVQERLQTWVTEAIAERLKPLHEIAKAEDISGLAKGIAFRLVENFGVVRRDAVQDDMKSLDQPSRGQLRKYGVRFGALNIFFPLMMKPASTDMALVLWMLKHGAEHGLTLDALKDPPRPGLTSTLVDPGLPDAYYRTLGFHVCDTRAVRIDMLERLADQIRPLVAWRAPEDNPSAMPPKGSTGNGAFTITPDMMSILGCSQPELGNVLKALGFTPEMRTITPPQPKFEMVADTLGVMGDGDGPGPIVVHLPEPVLTAEEQAAREPQQIEVWRPKRRFGEQRGEGRGERRQGEGRGQDGAGEQRRGGQGRGRKPWSERGQDRGQDRNQQRGGPPAQAVAGAPAEGAVAVQPQGDAAPRDGQRPDRRDNRGGDGKRFEAKRDGERKDFSKPRDDNRKGDDKRGGRDDKRGFGGGGGRGRDERRDRGERPPQQFRSGPQKNKGPDPDSPFAALMALKASLEKGKT